MNQNLGGKSATEMIAESRSEVPVTNISDDALRRVLLEACTLLQAIHEAVAADQSQGSSYTSAVLDTGLVSATYGLLDLLVLEGVYPSLTPGVGIQPERRKGSLLCNRTTKTSKDLTTLELIVYDTLNRIVFGNVGGGEECGGRPSPNGLDCRQH